MKQDEETLTDNKEIKKKKLLMSQLSANPPIPD